jgi:hypothetical protein
MIVPVVEVDKDDIDEFRRSEILEVCAREREIPKLPVQEVHYVTDDLLRQRLLSFDYGTDREEETRKAQKSASTYT